MVSQYVIRTSECVWRAGVLLTEDGTPVVYETLYTVSGRGGGGAFAPYPVTVNLPNNNGTSLVYTTWSASRFSRSAPSLWRHVFADLTTRPLFYLHPTTRPLLLIFHFHLIIIFFYPIEKFLKILHYLKKNYSYTNFLKFSIIFEVLI